MVSRKLEPFGTTIFAEMTRLAVEHDAINLAQGFPDFDGPERIRDAAREAISTGANQYSRSAGHPELTRAIAESVERHFGLAYDPMTEVVVVNGATEAIAAALLGILETGDEVVLFEPFYDSYHGCVSLAGAVPRFHTLRFPDFALDADALAQVITPRTRMVVLNTPHNPTGKVFTRDELELIAKLCREHDVIVVSDEVYEHIVFDDAEHVPMASLPGMRERTLTLSSSGKTFSLTGWKIGWATGPEPLVAATQAAHQFLTFCASTPLQLAVAQGLCHEPASYYETLRRDYQERRDVLLAGLTEAGFTPAVPRGTYFILADFSSIWEGDDRSFAEHLTKNVGVAAIPPSVFYEAAPDEGRRLLRFAFCKELPTLRRAAERLIRAAAPPAS